MKIVRPLTPLRRRMLEDLQIRNYSPHTVDAYLRAVAQFAKHFRTAPDRLGPEHIRTYQLHLLHQQVSESVFIQTVCALRFFHIPSNLVVDQWASDGESRSHRDFLVLHDV